MERAGSDAPRTQTLEGVRRATVPSSSAAAAVSAQRRSALFSAELVAAERVCQDELEVKLNEPAPLAVDAEEFSEQLDVSFLLNFFVPNRT